MTALIAALLTAGVATALITQSVWWGWPGGRIRRVENPPAFWALVSIQALLASYCAVVSARQLL